MTVSFFVIAGTVCIAIVLIKVLIALIHACNPSEQNNKRSQKLNKKLEHCFWVNKDGMWLYFNHWKCSCEPKAILLLCHGICEHSGRYARVAKALTEKGIEVFALDHRGHGQSDGYRNYINSMEDVIQDNCDFLNFQHTKRPSLPILVMGHSMGGMIAINVSYRMKQLVKASVFSAPALKLEPTLEKLESLVTCLQAVFPKLPVSFINADGLCHDPTIREHYTYDILNTPGMTKPVPARTALQLLRGLQEANRCAEEFTTPFLMMQGEEDSVCLPEGAKKWVEAAQSSDKSIKVWDGMYHEIMNEDEGDQVIEYAANWLANHLK